MKYKIPFILIIVLVFSCSQNDTNRLSSLFGKEITGDEVQAWFNDIKSKPEVEQKTEDVSYYKFRDKGILLIFNTGKLVAFELFSETANGYRQYQGSLPHGLTFSMTRSEIEEILGTPGTWRAGSNRKLEASYGNLSIVYDTYDKEDYGAKITTLTIFDPNL